MWVSAIIGETFGVIKGHQGGCVDPALHNYSSENNPTSLATQRCPDRNSHSRTIERGLKSDRQAGRGLLLLAA